MPSRILLVDDEAELLRALVVRLSAAGFSCYTATDGKPALASAQQQPPDLIIADLIMPEMDVYEMCERLKRDERTASIPVLVRTAVPSTQDQRLTKLGVARIMRKPFDSVELVGAVRDVMATTRPGGTHHG